MHARRAHYPAAEGYALGRVVIAAQHEYLRHARKICQKAVEQLHRFRAGHRLVVHVPRYQHAVGRLLARDVQYAGEDVSLVLRHRELVHALAEMQIGYM